MRIITLENCREELEKGGVIQRERLYSSSDKWKEYKLLKDVNIKLSNGDTIKIPKNFEWDLSSVPKVLWSIMSPDGDFEIAALIHDYLYTENYLSREFADKEMYKWSIVSNGTDKISFKNIDNWLRYIGVKFFGNKAWKD